MNRDRQAFKPFHSMIERDQVNAQQHTIVKEENEDQQAEEEKKGSEETDEDLIKYIEEMIGMMSTGDEQLDKENTVMLVNEMHEKLL